MCGVYRAKVKSRRLRYYVWDAWRGLVPPQHRDLVGGVSASLVPKSRATLDDDDEGGVA